MMSTDTYGCKRAQTDDREVVFTMYYWVTKRGKGGRKGVLTRTNVYFSFLEFVEV